MNALSDGGCGQDDERGARNDNQRQGWTKSRPLRSSRRAAGRCVLPQQPGSSSSSMPPDDRQCNERAADQKRPYPLQ